MSVLFEKTSYLTEKPFHYCPGCNHGIIHRLVAECLEESGMGEKIAGVAPVGCSVFAYDYFNCEPTRATATSPPSERQKWYTRHTAVKKSSRSSSTTQSTA